MPADIYLNGATIMTTTTVTSFVVAREAGFVGTEVRTERLLQAPIELAEAARAARPGEIWSVNGLQLHVDSQGRLDRGDLATSLAPRLRIARDIGATYLLVVPPRAAGVDVGRAIVAMRDGLRITVDAAAASGIRVAFEFLGFADCPVNTPILAASVVDGIESVELVLDSCHWHASGSSDLGGYPVDRIAMVHLNDAPAKPPRSIEDDDRILPGDGVIALPTLVETLRDRGYRGPYSLETFNPTYWAEDPADVAARGLARLRSLLDTPWS
jgi:2-keto-myo-inositol isomerase